MMIVYSNNIWSFSINNNDTSTTGTVNRTGPSGTGTIGACWIVESTAPAPCSPPDYHNPDAQWNAEKKRRELAGIKAAQRKHERIKLSACKATRKVLKYYREPRFNAVNVKMEVER